MFGYYRGFIYQYAKLVRPLNDLKKSGPGEPRGAVDTSSGTTTGTRDKRTPRCPAYNSKQPIEWTAECQLVFEELKRRMCNAPILAYPRFDPPFILYTDASADAFAGVLCQVWERNDYVTSESSTVMVSEGEKS